MTAVELESLFESTCQQLGVTPREARWGTNRVTTGGRAWAQYSVSLARSLFLFRAWSGGATSTQSAHILRMSKRAVRHWFADFRARGRTINVPPPHAREGNDSAKGGIR